MDTTAKFYLQRLYAQVEQARRRQYPNVGQVPAKWLALMYGRLKSAEVQLGSLHKKSRKQQRIISEKILVDITNCYEGLEALRHADTSQVAYPVVIAIGDWFQSADAESQYLFTAGTEFEVEPLYEKKEERSEHESHSAALKDLPKQIYQIKMPGGALGSTFHVPLVAHEAGHVLYYRYKAELDELLEAEIGETRSSVAFLLPDSVIRSIEGKSTEDARLEILDDWIAEVVADTVCGFIAGPAGFFALHEKLRGDQAPDNDYPHNQVRVASLGRYIKSRYQPIFKKWKIKPSQWNDWPLWNESDLLASANGHGAFSKLSQRFVTLLPAIRSVSMTTARNHIAHLEYTPERLGDDLREHLDDFLEAIPPIETKGDLRNRKPTDIASILNVGWFVASFALEKLNIKTASGVGQRLLSLDHLMLKAVELSQARLAWQMAERS